MKFRGPPRNGEWRSLSPLWSGICQQEGGESEFREHREATITSIRRTNPHHPPPTLWWALADSDDRTPEMAFLQTKLVAL